MRLPRSFFFLSVLLLIGPAPHTDDLIAHESAPSASTGKIIVPTLVPEGLTLTKGPFIASRGSQGYRGKRGKRGERGPRGCRGLRGEEGPPGQDGYEGIRGPAGFIGPTGPDGDPCFIGGPTGAQGPIGPRGSIGPTGPHGPACVSLNPKKPFIWDEFISGSDASGGIGALGWSLPVGNLLPPNPPWKHHPGICSLSGGSLLRLSPPSVNSINITDAIDVRMIVRVNTDLESVFGFFATGVETYVAFVSSHPENKECFSKKDYRECISGKKGEDCQSDEPECPPHAPNTWHIKASRPDACPVDIDTGIPVTTNWVTLRIFRPNAYHSVFFYINNMFIHMLPATSVPCGPIGFKIGSAGCCPDLSAIDVDYVSFRWPNLNR